MALSERFKEETAVRITMGVSFQLKAQRKKIRSLTGNM